MKRKVPLSIFVTLVVGCASHRSDLLITQIDPVTEAAERIAASCSARIRVKDQFIFFAPSSSCYQAFVDSGVRELLAAKTPTCIVQVDVTLGSLIVCQPALPEPLASMMWVTTNLRADLEALRILTDRSLGVYQEQVGIRKQEFSI